MKKPAACQKGKVRVQKKAKPVINKTAPTCAGLARLLSWIMAAGSVASCPDHAAERPIRVGSACSGWNSELMAWRRCASSLHPFSHVNVKTRCEL